MQIGQVVSEGTSEKNEDQIEGDVGMLIEQAFTIVAKARRMWLMCAMVPRLVKQ